MDAQIFQQYADLTYQETGILLKEGRQTMLKSRIRKRIRELGLADETAYLDVLKAPQSADERHQFINSITTNTTHFFREPAHFELMQKALITWKKEGRTKTRIWCAASSTGEEPYTIGMSAMEALKGRPGDMKILATDIDTGVLKRASDATYPEKNLKALRVDLKQKYFQPAPSDPESFKVKPELRRLFSFGRVNLTKAPYPMSGPLDIIFCRNVMIYFDNKTRSLIVDEAARLLRKGGILFVGHSEALTNSKSNQLARIGPATYLKGDKSLSPF